MAREQVLIVDDEVEIAAMLREMLEGLGYEVIVAMTGDEAIAAMATGSPQVVLLDLMMPGMPGLDALAYFRQHHHAVPVIVVTGAVEAEAGRQAQAAGAFQVIGKPFDLSLVQDVLAQAMQRARRDRAATGRAAISCAGLRVLVVDDHEDSRDLLQQILTFAGATVRLAGSAREACVTLDDIDVVVTDYSMPGETGLWLLARAQERPRPVPVIVVTGYADVHTTELSRAPFASILRKPVDPWRLCREVREVVRGG